MQQHQFNQLVNADIQRLMAPRKYSVDVQGLKNHRYTIDVLASSEDDAIDVVLMNANDDFRFLRCGEVEVLV
jgi:hypothetical protein